MTALRDLLVVGHQDKCGATLAVEVKHEIHDGKACGVIQATSWLVSHEDIRVHHESTRQRHALLLSTREQSRAMRKSFA
jgi:hypothetical protein